MKEDEVSTVVGSSVHLTGTLKDDSDIVVHGSVEGEVRSEQNVIVGDAAKIKGPISAQNVSISGDVDGTITAADKLEIHPTGHVAGNIKAKDLVIHSGAYFSGKSEMLADSSIDEKSSEETTDEVTPESEADETVDEESEGDEDDNAILIEEEEK